MARTASKKIKIGGQVEKKRASDYVFTIVNTGVFLLFALICFFPFYYLFINTISSNALVVKGEITFYPKDIHFNNYANLLYVPGLIDSILVTVSRTVIGTVAMVVVSGFAGYIFTQRKMWKRKFWYRFIIIPMFFNAGLVPWYMTMLGLGLTNNYFAYILPNLVVPFNIIMVKTFIESVPPDMEEGARIDGAGTLTICFKIMFPLSMPILATIAIFGAVNHWNSFQDSLILMNNSKGIALQTLQHQLYLYLRKTTALDTWIGMQPSGGSSATALNRTVVQYTIAVVSIIPIVLVYPFMQRFFVKGIMMGAVKG